MVEFPNDKLKDGIYAELKLRPQVMKFEKSRWFLQIKPRAAVVLSVNIASFQIGHVMT